MFGSVKALSVLFSLIRNKLIAIWIGPAGVGLIILYNSISDLVSTTTRLNIDQSSVRNIAVAAHHDVAVTVSVVRWWAFVLGLAGLVLMCVLSPLLSSWSFGNTDLWWTFCIMGLVPFSYSMSTAYNSIMQGLHEFSRLARCGIVTAVGGIVISIPLLWFLRQDAIVWVIVSYSLFSLTAALYYRVRIPRVHLPLRQIWQQGAEFIRLGVLITIGFGMGQLFNYLFVLFMNTQYGTTELGLFQAGYTIINTYVAILFSGMWMEYFPHLTAVIHSPARVATVVSHRMVTTAWVLMPVMALFIALDDILVQIVYARSFMTMLPYITIGMAGMALRMSSWCIAHTIIAKGNGKLYVVTETISGIICLVLNILGYSFFGFYGLGAAYILWYGLYLMLVYIVYRRAFKFHLKNKVMHLTLSATAFALLCLAARYGIGWWASVLLGLAILPFSYKHLMKN